MVPNRIKVSGIFNFWAGALSLVLSVCVQPRDCVDTMPAHPFIHGASLHVLHSALRCDHRFSFHLPSPPWKVWSIFLSFLYLIKHFQIYSKLCWRWWVGWLVGEQEDWSMWFFDTTCRWWFHQGQRNLLRWPKDGGRTIYHKSIFCA